MSRKSKILIVDDEPDNIRILAESLIGDYKLIGATSGQEALECISKEEHPDLILLDIMMRGMNGYEVIKQLKADQKTRDIPVIFITAMGRELNEVRGFELGAVDYVIKPFSPAAVSARVRTHLELKYYREHLERSVHERTEKIAESNKRLRNEVLKRKQTEEQLEEVIEQRTLDLQNALGEVKAVNEQLRKEIAERNETEEKIKKAYSLLSSTIESVAEAIVVVDKYQNLIAFNKKFIEIWRLSEEWAKIPKSRERFVQMAKQLKDPATFINRVRELTDNLDTEAHEIFAMQDGRIFECYARPYRIGDKSVGRVYSYLDITESEKNLTSLRESKICLEMLLDLSDDFLFIFDTGGYVRYANDEATRRLGYSEAELKGKHIVDLHPPDSRGKILADFEGILSGEKKIWNIPLLTRDGSRISVESAISPRYAHSRQGRNEKGQVVFGISRPIRESAQTEEPIQSAEPG